MARSTKHLINVHTSTGTTEPSGANLYLGEIAVQHTPENPALWIKMGTGETSEVYEKFIGSTEINNLISNVTTLGSGYTYSGIPYVNSSTTFADAYSALTNELIIDEETISAAFNDVNDRIIELSGRTVPTKVSQLENDVPYVTSAETTGMLTGVSMNGLEASVTNHVANLGNVVTAETQLSTATTGNGNVITSLSVSNHQITTNKGMTIPAWATAATKPTYTASEVGALPTGTTLDGMPDGTTRKLSDFFKNAEYDSGTKRINFKNGDTVLDYIDATDFIKDGMVSAVTISGSNMVISFNTDAGKEDITLSLTDIFNPENYYDKDHINSALTHYLPLSGGYMDLTSTIGFGGSTMQGTTTIDANEISIRGGYFNGHKLEMTDENADGGVGGIYVTDSNLHEYFKNYDYTFPLKSGTVALTSDISNILGSGYTYSGIPYVNSSTTIADAYSALTNEFLEEDLVVAAAFNDVNDRIIELSGRTVPTRVSELENDVPYMTVASGNALSAAVVTLSARSVDVEMILGSGYTYSGLPYVNSATSIADAYSALTKEFLDDEEAIAQIVNDLDSRINILSGKTVPVPTKVSELVNDVPYITESAFTVGLEALSASVVANKTKITSNERVTAMALNDLNDRKADKSYIDSLSGAVEDVYDILHPGSASTIPAGGFVPNVLYNLGTLTGNVTFSYAQPTDPGIENEYRIRFTAGTPAPNITWGNVNKWAGNCIDPDTHKPALTAGNVYEISVADGLAIIVEYI